MNKYLPLNTNLEWLTYNTVLAAIPFWLALILFKFYPKSKKINLLWFLGFILYFLFLPNAPYVITDSMHLFNGNAISSGESYPQAFITVFTFVIISTFLFIRSYKLYEDFFKSRFKIDIGLLRLISFFAISVGIYLGRFVRLNSWDAIIHPIKTILSLSSLLSVKAIVYVFLFTNLLMFIFFLYDRFERK